MARNGIFFIGSTGIGNSTAPRVFSCRKAFSRSGHHSKWCPGEIQHLVLPGGLGHLFVLQGKRFCLLGLGLQTLSQILAVIDCTVL